jgi:hypothetical protein
MSASARARPQHGYRARPAPLRLTGRGSLVVMLAVFMLGNLIATWAHVLWLAGLGYAAGGLLAVAYSRRDALLAVVTGAPALFLGALVVVELLTAPGASALATLEGTLLTLAANALWLLAVTAAYLAAAMLRGLPRCVRDLRDALAGQAAGGQAALQRPRPPAPG